MALAAHAACDSCGLLFPSDELLAKHKSRYCTGSYVDQRLAKVARQANDESSWAPDALATSFRMRRNSRTPPGLALPDYHHY